MMSQLQDIESAQKCLEDTFNRRMNELESQLHSSGPAKDTVAKVAEEFRTFRELMFTMLGLLRKQINECFKIVDSMETRHRRKSLILLGVPEVDGEDCTNTILDVLHKRLGLNDILSSNIQICHRIGVLSKERTRPILVRFASLSIRSSVWKIKTRLKGSSISVREFLTKARQTIFSKARQHFGLRAAWTQDGSVIVKVPNGIRHKITSMEELDVLLVKHPRAGDDSSQSAVRGGTGPSGKTSHQARK